jgi:hypothetical protein
VNPSRDALEHWWPRPSRRSFVKAIQRAKNIKFN